jgi:hypothetical protein
MDTNVLGQYLNCYRFFAFVVVAFIDMTEAASPQNLR